MHLSSYNIFETHATETKTSKNKNTANRQKYFLSTNKKVSLSITPINIKLNLISRVLGKFLKLKQAKINFIRYLPYSIPPSKKNNPIHTLVERFLVFKFIFQIMKHNFTSRKCAQIAPPERKNMHTITYETSDWSKAQ